jgi:hypothetical protein
MALTAANVLDMRAVGTVLIEFLPAEEDVDWSNRRYFKDHAEDQRKFIKKAARNLRPGEGIYGLGSDCGFLEITDDGAPTCSVHEEPDIKPRICGEFREGSRTCLKTRERVVNRMRENDELLPDLIGAALGKAVLQTL